MSSSQQQESASLNESDARISLSTLIGDINLNRLNLNSQAIVQAITNSIPSLGSAGALSVASKLFGIASAEVQDTPAQPPPEEAAKPLFNQSFEMLYSYTITCIENSYRGSKQIKEPFSNDPRKMLSGTWIDSLTQAQCTLLHTIARGASTHYKYSLITQNHDILANVRISNHSNNSVGHSPAQNVLTDISKAIAPLSPGQPVESTNISSYEFHPLLSYWESRLSHTIETDYLPWRPFLMTDQFRLLVKLGFTAVNSHDVNVWNLIRLLFTAELTKACTAVADSILGQFVGAPDDLKSVWSFQMFNDPDHNPSTRWAENIRIQKPETLKYVLQSPHSEMYTSIGPGIIELLVWIVEKLGCHDRMLHTQIQKSVDPAIVAKLVLTLVLPFLRKAAGFILTTYGLDICQEAPWLETARQEAKANPSKPVLDYHKEPEIKRLLRLLRLPSLDALCVAPIRNPSQHTHTIGLMECWLKPAVPCSASVTPPFTLRVVQAIP